MAGRASILLCEVQPILAAMRLPFRRLQRVTDECGDDQFFSSDYGCVSCPASVDAEAPTRRRFLKIPSPGRRVPIFRLMLRSVNFTRSLQPKTQASETNTVCQLFNPEVTGQTAKVTSIADSQQQTKLSQCRGFFSDPPAFFVSVGWSER